MALSLSLPAARAPRGFNGAVRSATARRVGPCAAVASGAPAPRAAYPEQPLRPLGMPGAGSAAAPRVGDSMAAETEMRRYRKWHDVLHQHSARAAGGAEWGAAGAFASLRRLARSLSIYDHKVQSQARTARDRAAAAVRDTRFAPLAAAVNAALPGLDLHRLDAVRSAYAALGYEAGTAAVDAELRVRFAAQRRVEAVEAAQDAEAVLAQVARCADTLDAGATVAVLRALVECCDSDADAAHVVRDSRFALLLDALARHVDSFADDRAAPALDALARLGAAPPPQLVEALVGALMRRTLATGKTSMVPTHVLQALAAMPRLRCTLRTRAASAMAAIVVGMLPTCPPYKLAPLLSDALASGVAPQPLLAAAAPLLPLAARAATPEQLAALAAALAAAGAAPEVVAQLQAAPARRPRAAAAAPRPRGASVAPRAIAAAARAPGAAQPALRGLGFTPLRHCAPPRGSSCRRGACVARATKPRTTAAQQTEEDANEPINWSTAAFAFVVPALGGALFGYDIGVTSGALVSLTGAATSGTDWGTALTSLQSGFVVSSSLAGAVAGSALALTAGERIGRRAELLVAAALYGSGAALMAAAPSLGVLIAGRALYGGGIGFAMHGAPIYIAETAPSRVRGALISAKEAFIVGGILLGYVAGAVLVDAPGGWREMLGVSAVPAALLGAGMALLPDSPRWLLQAGRGSAAAGDALAALRGAAVPRAVINADVARFAANAATRADSAGSLEALLAPRNARALYAGLSLMLFQQITGCAPRSLPRHCLPRRC
jgi:MFS family permease